MWAYTDEEIDYLSPAVGASGATPRAESRSISRPARKRIARSVLPNLIRAWLRREAASAALFDLDARTLADLGINRGDFPRILAGTFTRDG